MSIERIVARNQARLRKKNAKRALKEVQSLMEAMPDGCAVCGAAFTPRETPEQMDTWLISVKTNEARLVCGDCRVGQDGKNES